MYRILLFILPLRQAGPCPSSHFPLSAPHTPRGAAAAPHDTISCRDMPEAQGGPGGAPHRTTLNCRDTEPARAPLPARPEPAPRPSEPREPPGPVPLLPRPRRCRSAVRPPLLPSAPPSLLPPARPRRNFRRAGRAFRLRCAGAEPPNN